MACLLRNLCIWFILLKFNIPFCFGYFDHYSSACGDVLQATESEDANYLDSPRFPDFYPNNVDCSWEISGPPGSRIHLSSAYFAIEDQPECLWDYLSIEEVGVGDTSQTAYCGHETLNFLSRSNLVRIRFHSDDSGAESGFRIHYSAVTRPPMGSHANCNRTLTVPGEIATPGYPYEYPPQAKCYYFIQAPLSSKIRVTFSEFHVESYPCSFDKLLVYNGSLFEPPIGAYCGRERPQPVVSQTNQLILHFISDDSLEFPGFKARVDFIEEVTTGPPTPGSFTSPPSGPTADGDNALSTDTTSKDVTGQADEGCNVTITSPTGKITSPGFPGEYPHDTVCVTRLRSDKISSFLVRFFNFTLEESEDCSYDSVTIYPVAPPSSAARTTTPTPSEEDEPPPLILERVEPPLRVICGSVLHQKAVVSWEGFGLDIEFRSDRSVSGSGFVAETLIAQLDEVPRCPDVCQNGGSCIEVILPDGAIDWECSCAPGFTGNMCQTRLPESCQGVICHNHGICVNLGGHVICDCPSGFSGRFCEERSNRSGNSGMYFTRMTGNTSLSIGSSIILECAVNDPTAAVMWLFHDRILTKADASWGVELHPGGVVVISEVKDEFSGRYTCMAESADELIEQSLWLSLKEPCTLDVVKAPQNQTVQAGQTAMFECQIPDADVILWRKDGDLIDYNARKRLLINKYLVISDIIETDSGQYTCAARSQSGCFVQVTAELKVDRAGHSIECGKPRTGPWRRYGRISMGQEAEPGSAPWHAIIRERKKGQTFCGGTLISADTVMTAAHCVKHFEPNYGYPFNPQYIEIYLGTTHCGGQDGTFRLIKSYIVHEQFNDTHYNNDIALFKLTSPVGFRDDIMPICLESPEFLESLLKPGQMGKVTGCGARTLNGASPKYLNEIQIPYVARELCGNRAAAVNTTFTSGMFCAGYKMSLRGDACRGDSGGAYVLQYHGRSIQAGIVSWGVGCDKENHYGYYTNLAHYYTWIMDRI